MLPAESSGQKNYLKLVEMSYRQETGNKRLLYKLISGHWS